MLTERLMRLAIASGGEWVMVLLLVLSVVSVAIMVERILFFRRQRRRLERLDEVLTPLIERQDTGRMREVLESEQGSPTLRAAVVGYEVPHRDRDSAEKVVQSSLGRERLVLERRLIFLGTLGNNAPFIGLFGTVLGIIRAFHDLSLNSKDVMTGISQALVATAVGLFVALPAVLAFNYFQKQADRSLAITEALAQGILAGLPASDKPAAAEEETAGQLKGSRSSAGAR